jgi:ribonuclease R
MLNPEGEIVEILGKTGSYDTEVISLAREYNLPYKFTDQTLQEARDVPQEIVPGELENRVDLRAEEIFTIDPEDAKDFDDALSISEWKMVTSV